MKARLLILFFIVFSLPAVAQDWKQLSDSLIYYYQRKDYTRAIPAAIKATAATKEKFGDTPVYGSFLSLTGGLYVTTQQWSLAEPYMVEALRVYRKSVGEEHKDFTQTINVLAIIYSNLGQNYKAAPLLLQASNIYKKKFGEDNVDYAASLNKLGKIYEESG